MRWSMLKSLKKFSSKQRKVVLCLAMAGTMVMTTGFTSQGAKEVHINVDGRSVQIYSTHNVPALILNDAGIKLNEKDEYQLKKVENVSEITVYRAVPVTITYGDSKKEVLTSKQTVAEALKDLGYDPADYDAALGMDTKITQNIDIVLTDSEAKLQREREEAEARAAAEAAARQPKVSTSWGEVPYVNAITMEASAYLPSDGGGSGITASGMVATYGVAAVDPDVIPLGTRLYIPGYGEAIAADVGGSIEGNMIDLCMEDYGQAMDFGRRDVTVYVLQ